MCGIVGYTGTPDVKKTKKLLKLIRHRGHDESITAFTCGLNIGMNRLSIQDLTKGYYPFEYKHFSMIFNGEIYNYPELKQLLERKGVTFSTNCDAEVILPLFDHYGTKAFTKLEGMFAILIVDQKQQQAYLAKDKAGEKPLYYLQNKKEFAFASELKCLLSLTSNKQLNTSVLPDYLLHGSVSKGQTLVTGIQKLPAAHVLKLDLKTLRTHLSPYWKIPEKKPSSRSEAEALTHLDTLLAESVTKRMIADVPVGTFLSGGVDSSLITYYAHHNNANLNTYSIAFPDGGRHDESDYAQQVADVLGTHHHTIPFNAESAREMVSNLGSLIDEPIVDPAFMPTMLLAQEARKSVKVVLTGEGADEVFGGYYRYYKYLGIQKLRSLLPFYSSISTWNSLLVIPKLKKLFDPNPIYSPQIVWQKKEIQKVLTSTMDMKDDMPLPNKDILRTLELYDLKWYLAEQLLMKVDKATMAHNLESRAPFLDSEVMAFGLNLPFHFKLKGIHNKYLLRKLAEQHLSPQIAWRLKHGFSLPLGRWFKNELRDVVHESIDNLLSNTKGLNHEYIREITHAHVNGKADHANKIWSLIVLSKWMKANEITWNT